jgi:homoserine O-succinyltransferase
MSSTGTSFDWTQTHTHACLTICWGVQAAVRHFHDLPKHVLPKKMSGVYSHRNLPTVSSDSCQ